MHLPFLQAYFNAWLVNDAKRHIFVALWVILQVTVFVVGHTNYEQSDNFTNMREAMGSGFAYFKATTLNLHLTTAVILLPLCRTIISYLRRTPLNRIIPFDDAILFHQLIGYTICFFAVLHMFIYAVVKASPDSSGKRMSTSEFINLWFGIGPQLVGNLMMTCLILIFLTSLPFVIRRYHELFWYTHHISFIFFGLFSFHGSWCEMQPDREPKCEHAGVFWKYWIFSGILYTIERILREVRARRGTFITKVLLHPSDVVEIQFRRADISYKPGQYIILSCPEVSLLEWHPFTLTSAPQEDFLSIHMRQAGDFTQAFARRLGCGPNLETKKMESVTEKTEQPLLPVIHIDGPFGSASQDVFKYEVITLFAAGIGVTPFASILKSIWYRIHYPDGSGSMGRSMRLKKVHFYWICRDYQTVEWFQDLLRALEEEDKDGLLEIQVYLTGELSTEQIHNVALNDASNKGLETNGDGPRDAMTGLQAPTYYGRPNMDVIFERLSDQYHSTDVGVFVCGPKSLEKSIHVAANTHSQAGEDGTRFIFNKENF
ncbi:NADPH oxidase B [Piptocephalis cylindrospora]|uniref:NADPH oxidase B n=1 Tax=Piptocephalis cylindrospora TaxID=1907219 RepID=A0A4P9XYQ3_9FUNG|nr:NADPH oxidase B [Piptocephalis cylindrospora]|eukprot:RKP11573.1 NADPH oxidase B [Piptocephalis cylindrospora]